MAKQALITGTSRGIGLSLARRLLCLGWKVHGIGRSAPVELASNPAYDHHFCDLAALDDLPASMSLFLKAHPDLSQLDMVFLNSGQFGDGIRRVSDTPMEELLYLQRLNCFSIKAVLDPLIAAGVRIPLCAVSASIAGRRARAGNGGYALSKATLNMLMELYAIEHPATFFAVIGLCVVDTHLSNKIGTLPLPQDRIFVEQAKLRARVMSATASYAVTPDERADHLISLLLPRPDPRLISGRFIEVRDLLVPDHIHHVSSGLSRKGIQ